MSEKTAEILERAADVIKTRGWFQGDFYDSGAFIADGRPIEECAVCAGGGINVGADHVPDVYEPEGALLEALEAFACHVDPAFRAKLDAFNADRDALWEPDVYEAIGNWNDADDRTAEEVVAALRECAAAERTREAGR